MNKVAVVLGVCTLVVFCVLTWVYLSNVDHTLAIITPVIEQTPQTLTITFPLAETITAHDDPADTPDAPRSMWQYDNVVLEKNMAVTGIRATVENAPPEIIHHLALVTLGHPDAVCGNSSHLKQREYFTISRSNIYDPVEFPAPYAIMMKEGEELSLEVMTHVLEKPFGPGGTYPDAIVKIEITYEEMYQERTKPVAFIRLRLDDTECGEPLMHQAFVVPKGDGLFTLTASTSDSTVGDSSDTYTFSYPGVILSRSANLWGTKGGQTLDVLKNNTIIETYTAVQGDQPWQWTVPMLKDPLTVAVGDTLAIQTTYKQSTSTDIMDASGIYGFYFAPDLTVD